MQSLLALSSLVRPQRKENSHQNPDRYWHPNFGLLASRAVSKLIYVVLSLPGCVVVLWQCELVNTSYVNFETRYLHAKITNNFTVTACVCVH